MKTVYVAGMVIYPPDNKFPETRKYITYYEVNEGREPDQCWTGNYEHHNWVSEYLIQIGAKCFCGKERAIKDD